MNLRSQNDKALTGIVVVEVGTVVNGPYAGQLLADLGATVIKVESLEGDITRSLGAKKNPGMASIFLQCNRGKQSIALDVKHPHGLKILKQLVTRADVFLHNMRADAAQRLGIGSQELAAVNPLLVYCATYGYGNEGPYAGRPAYDDVIQSASGLAALKGRVDGKPAYSPTLVADKVTALFSVVGILAALLKRARTGHAEELEVAMFEAMANFVTVEHLGGCAFVPPIGRSGYPRALAEGRRPYRTKDGYLAVLPYSEKHWIAFAHIIGKSGMLQDERFCSSAARGSNSELLHEEICRALSAKGNAEWIKLLEAGDVPHSEMNDVEDLFRDPHLETVGFWKHYEHPTEGTLVAPSFPVRFGGPVGDAGPAIGVPHLGEHTMAILKDMGYSRDEIKALQADRVIGVA